LERELGGVSRVRRLDRPAVAPAQLDAVVARPEERALDPPRRLLDERDRLAVAHALVAVLACERVQPNPGHDGNEDDDENERGGAGGQACGSFPKMSTTPRWEGDQVGSGVGDAGELAPGVRRLLEEMVAPDWVAEDPQVHLLPNLQRELAEPSSPWRLVDDVVISAVYTLTLAWGRSDGTIEQLRRDVFALVGAVAQTTTHVSQRIESARIEFDVVTGVLEGDSKFRPHGHMLRFKVVGEAAERVAFAAE
jgi:hypothetical protein